MKSREGFLIWVTAYHRRYKLTKPQLRFAELLIEEANRDHEFRKFITARGTGKSSVLDLINLYCQDPYVG